MKSKVKIVILAAGKGVRMGGDLPKALVAVDGKPMLEYLIEGARQTVFTKPVVVIGHKKEAVKKIFGDTLVYVTQDEQRGTAHALLQAQGACAGAKKIAVFYGDHPFTSSETMKKLLEKSKKSGAEITLATTIVPNFKKEYKVFRHFARILRDNKKIVGIREYKEASEKERQIKEVNPGYYVFEANWLWPDLEKIQNKNSQGEFYLTDLLHMASDEGVKIESIRIPPREAMGANSPEELEILKRLVV